MKKEGNATWKTLVTLLAVIFSVIFTVGNHSIVNAAENDTTTETQKSEKELVQCSDDWVIFQYKDSEGEPTFDILYQDKSVKELEDEGYTLQYRIIVENYDMPIYVGNWTYTEKRINLGIPKNYCKVQFRLINSDEEISMSDSFSLERDDDLYVYVLHSNDNYYYDLNKKINHFKLRLKLNGHLKQIDDLSISTNIYSFGIEEYYRNMVQNHLLSHPISNIIFENYSEIYIFEGKTYSIDYSTISFDADILPTLNDLDTDYCYRYLIDYIFTFNGLVGYNNKPIKNYTLHTETPAFSTDELVNTIQISAPSSSIKVGNSIKLTANVLPDTARNKKLDWYSSNEDYATVDEKGVVTAESAGAGKAVTITVEATDGSGIKQTYILNIDSVPSIADKPSTPIAPKDTISNNSTNNSTVSASSNFKNKKVLIKKIKLKAKKSVKVGKKLKIKLTVNSDATNKAVKWSISNKKYAKINSKGVLTAKKAGKGKTVKVTAKAKDGSGQKATIKIKIKK